MAGLYAADGSYNVTAVDGTSFYGIYSGDGSYNVTVLNSQALDDMSTTWNDGGTTFTAIKMNVTDTTSAAASSLLDLQVGGASLFRVQKDGQFFGPSDADPFTVRWGYANLLNAGTIFMGAAGPDAGSADTAATGFGYQALQLHTGGGGCTAAGFRALRSDVAGTDHTAFGDRALELNNGGVGCSAFGKLSLNANQAGGGNSGFGDSTLLDNETGEFNAAFGYGALSVLTDGDFNVGIGVSAGRSLTGAASNNVFLGYSAGYNASQKVDALNSMALGHAAYTTADNQIVIGNTSHTATVLRGAVTGPTSVAIASGTITDPALLISATATWNDAADTFGALRVNVTDTASAAASMLAEFQIGGVNVASVRKDGRVTGANFVGSATSASLTLNDASITRVSAATLLFNGGYGGTERNADPSDPAEGRHTIWQSDGTGAGDDGDIMVKITAGGVTKTATLVDFSAVV